jgi:3-methyl-2-oxobutanoate hydroxymethyltransferase
MSTLSTQKSVTVPWLRSQKNVRQLTMLTAYDYPTACFLDEVGIDMLLVGDSVGTVIYGDPNTLSVTLDDMIRHTRAVSKAAKRALVIADMPFMSYQVNVESAVINAGRLIKEASAQAIKLEGGLEVSGTVRAITRAGIPVVGHIGLTPQSINAMGTYRMHGKSVEERAYLLESAVSLEEAGAFSIVLECVEPGLAQEISQKLSIPTIGIGSGADCDGQVLVTHDLVGLTVGRVPRFVHPLASLKEPLKMAVTEYIHRTLNRELGTPEPTQSKGPLKLTTGIKSEIPPSREGAPGAIALVQETPPRPLSETASSLASGQRAPHS